MMAKEFFIVTSPAHMGPFNSFGRLACRSLPLPAVSRQEEGIGRGRKGSKKIPSLLHEDWGFYPL
jgi:hypothetical protein